MLYDSRYFPTDFLLIFQSVAPSRVNSRMQQYGETAPNDPSSGELPSVDGPANGVGGRGGEDDDDDVEEIPPPRGGEKITTNSKNRDGGGTGRRQEDTEDEEDDRGASNANGKFV